MRRWFRQLVRRPALGVVLPIADVPVAVIPLSWPEDGYVDSTDASGVYTITGVPPGQYFSVALPSEEGAVNLEYMNEVFGNIPCPVDCDVQEVADGTFIAVTSGATTSNINYALARTGRVTGTVTNATTGAPVSNVTVVAVLRLGASAQILGSTSTDAAGAYALTRIPEGQVYLYVANTQALIPEIYDNVKCLASCSPSTAVATGTAVSVTAGATTSGRDFALSPGGAISGTITNGVGGAPIANMGVQVITRVNGINTSFNSAASNASGVYTVGGLPEGNYFAFTTVGGGNFVNELYDNISCPVFCNPLVAGGVEIPVTLGATTSGRDFALSPGGAISGVVTNQATAAPVGGVQVNVVTRVGNVFPTRIGFTNASGQYTVSGLPTGTYWVYTSNAPGGLINEIFDDIPCIGPCSQSAATTTGASVTVAQGATTSGRNFALSPGGGISGVILDEVTGTRTASGIGVNLYALSNGSKVLVGSVETDFPAGAFNFGGLPGGTYFLSTFGDHLYRNEVYDNIPCVDMLCTAALSSAGPIAVTAGTTITNRNFNLARAIQLVGKVTDVATGLPIEGVSVSLYKRTSGLFVGTATTGYRGAFLFQNIANGSYVAFTSNTSGYINEIYNDIACATTCSSATALASGTPITVASALADAAGDIIGGVNFALSLRNAPPAAPTNFRAVGNGFAATFSWTAPSSSITGVPISYVIDAGVTPGGTIVNLPAGSATSVSVPGVPPGVFYVRVRAVNAFGSSPPSNEITLVMAGSGVSLSDAPPTPAAFVSGGRLTLTWAAPVFGGPPTSYLVEAGSASGLTNIAILPVARRAFTYDPVPPGFYFLRVRAVNAAGAGPPSPEVMIVSGNVPAPPGAPNFTSHAVDGSTVTLNWTAPSFGTPPGYIIEAGSAPGLSNLAVANTGSANTTATFGGVPPGTYYVRLRAVNAQGASVVSNQRTIIVP